MKTWILLSLILCLGGTVLAQQPKIREPKPELPEAGFVTVELATGTIPTVKVKVNGTVLKLGVDTGCQGSGILTPEALKKAGLEVEMTLPTMGNTGRSEMGYTRIDTLEMGNGRWRDYHVAVLPLKGTDLDGLVGAEVLFGQPFYMDLSNRTMILGKVPDTSGAREVSCFSRGGHVNVNLDVDGRKAPVLIDSGASMSYLTAMKYRGKVASRGYAPVATVRGVSMQKVEVCLPERVELQGVPLKGVTFHRDNEHNILGNDFLRAHPIAVDRAARRLWLFEPVKAGRATDAAAKAEPTR